MVKGIERSRERVGGMHREIYMIHMREYMACPCPPSPTVRGKWQCKMQREQAHTGIAGMLQGTRRTPLSPLSRQCCFNNGHPPPLSSAQITYTLRISRPAVKAHRHNVGQPKPGQGRPHKEQSCKAAGMYKVRPQCWGQGCTIRLLGMHK